MHRTLVASLVLLAIAQSSAVAQACLGLASYSTGPIQVTASGGFNDLSASFGATAGYGIPSSVFGTLGVATMSYEPDNGSSLELAARAGYQISIGTARPIQVCPVASFGYGMGPGDDVAGFDRSSRTAMLGVHAGFEMMANPRMKVVPSVGLSYAHGTEKAENNGGATLYEISNSYGMGQIAVGIILKQNISVRPTLEIPFNHEGTTPTVGLTVGFNFGPFMVGPRRR